MLLPALDIGSVVFLDECGINTKMARLSGRAPLGQRLVASLPHGHWHTSTFIAGLRHDRVDAPWVLDRAMNGDAFLVWLETQLAPTLSTGDVVIMDNLSSHKVAGVQEIIEDTGATLLYLPPYSPDLNPIEMLFSKIKAALRRAAKRCKESLFTEIGNILDSINPTECENYIRHCGYGST